MLALERGEVEGRGSNPWSEWKAAQAGLGDARSKIIPLMQMSLFKHPDLPDVPLMVDLAPNDTARAVFELVTITGETRTAVPDLARRAGGAGRQLCAMPSTTR